MANTATAGHSKFAQPLRYGNLVNLYKQSLGGYVVATSSLDAPVGLQRDTPEEPLRYEETVFLLQQGDPAEATASRRPDGDVVKYGQAVRLLHYAHHRCLGYHSERHAAGMKGNLRVALENRSSNAKVLERWRIMPRYRLRMEGEPVVAGDPIILQATGTGRYLNVASNVDEEAADSSFLEVSAGEDVQGFLMRLYDGDCASPMGAPPLRCGDCVTLLHTEEHKYIRADLTKRQCMLQTPDSHMREAGGVPGEGSEHAVSWYAASKEEMSYLSLFVIEGANATEGGAVRTSGARGLYRLKSLASGLYMRCGEGSAEEPAEGRGAGGGRGATQASYAVSLTPHAHATGTLFQLHCASPNGDEFLSSGGRVLISCALDCHRKVWLGAGGPVAAAGEDACESEVTIASLTHRARSHGSVTLLGRALKSMRDGLEVRRLQSMALEELYTIRRLLPPLQRYAREMARGVGGPLQVRQVYENVLQLQQLCHRAADADVEDASGELTSVRDPGGAVLDPERQSKLFQQGVAELALLVVRASLQCPYVHAERLRSPDMVDPQAGCRKVGESVAASGGGSAAAGADVEPLAFAGTASLGAVRGSSLFVPMRYSEVGDLVDACFQLVGLLLYDRPRYAGALQGYADFVMECTRYVPSALRCVAAFFKDNLALVELPMARHRLDFFLGMLTGRGHNPNVLHILQLFACCGGEGMAEAQRVIVDCFTQNRKMARQVLCPIKWMPLPEELWAMPIARTPPEEAAPSALAAAAKQRKSLTPADTPAFVESESTSFQGSAAPSSCTHEAPMALSLPEGLRDASSQMSLSPASALPPHGPTAEVPARSTSVKARREALMAGIPNSLFAEADCSGATLCFTSAQSRGKASALGKLLQKAANAKDLGGTTYFPLEGLLAVMPDWPEMGDTMVLHLAAQIRLLAALAHGDGCASNRRFVFEWVPRAVLVEGVRSEALPRHLHGALLELFAKVMLDVDGALNIREQIQSIRCVVSPPGGGASSVAVSSTYQMAMREVPHELAVAKRFTVRYMKATPLSGDDSVAAEYLAVLDLVDALVNAGAFELSEYETLMRLVMRCVDPSCNDQRTYLEVQSVHQCKSRALRLTNMLLDVLLVREALWLVDCFRMGRRPRRLCQLTHINFAVPFQERRFVKWKASKWRDDEVDQPMGRRADGAGDQDLNALYKEEGREEQEELMPISEAFTALLELANRSRSAALQRQVIFTFFRATNFLEELYATARRAQLLTSEESLSLYTDISRTAMALRRLANKAFRRADTVELANRALDALDRLLLKPQYGTVAEKLSMMQRAGVPLQLIRLLERVPVPVSETSRHLVSRAVTVLQTTAQSPCVRAQLRVAAADAAPLVYQNTSYISLLRTLFISEDDDRTPMPAQLLADVVKCLYGEHSASAAIEFLSDWLTARSSSVHAMAQRQQQVWRAMVSDPQAERCIQLRHSWCSDRGCELRERLLTSDDCYEATGRVCTHLELCRLLCLVANGNELVRADEMRREVFGQRSLDALLQVTADAHVPVYFRYPYVQLLQALALDDASAVPLLLTHREFTGFVRLCMLDAVRYLHLLGGRCAVAEVCEELQRSEDAALRRAPRNEAEREMEEARFGAGMYADFFFGPLCACTQRMCAGYRGSISQLPCRVRSRLSVVVNELVDAVCDVVQFFHEVEDGIRSAPSHSASLPTSAKRVPYPEEHCTRPHFAAVRECLRVAREAGFNGTARWRGDAIERLYGRLDKRVEVATNTIGLVAAAAVNRASMASLTPGVVLGCGDGCERSSDTDADGCADALTNAWIDYLRSVVVCDERMAEENRLISGAGILLRTGARGVAFMRVLFTVLPSLEGDNMVHVLTLIRQLVVLTPNNPYDDSALLPLAAPESDASHITVATPVPSRQAFLAQWGGDSSLEVPLPLIALVGAFVGHGRVDVQRAALLAGCTLLMRGHRGMQECYRSCCRRSPKEPLLFTLRNHLMAFRDELQAYHNAVVSGSCPSEAEHYLTRMSNCCLELKLLQLLCAGQYAPLQTYLVSQPDNIISVNIVEALVELLSMAPKTANETTLDFVMQLLSTIAEALQGPCVVNQDAFVAYNAADYLTMLLSELNTFPQTDAALTAAEVVLPAVSRHEAVRDRGYAEALETAAVEERRRRRHRLLQTMALSTLLAMIEGRDDSRLALKLVSTVDLSVLSRAMDRSAAAYEACHGLIERKGYNNLSRGDIAGCAAVLHRYFIEYVQKDHPTSREELQDELAIAVGIYAFFRACHDMHVLAATRSQYSSDDGGIFMTGFAGPLDEFVDKKGQSMRQALSKSEHYRQVGTRLAKIEIVRNGRLERVYFRVLNSAIHNLFDFRRTAVIQSAVRTSDNERIQHFFSDALGVMIEMKWYNNMRRFCVAYLLSFFRPEINVLGLWIVLIINLVSVIGVRAPTSPYTSGTSESIDRALIGLGIANVCMQFVLLAEAAFGPAVVGYKTGWQSWHNQRELEAAKMSRADIAADRGDVLLLKRQKRSPAWAERMLLSAYYAVCHAGFLPHVFFCFVSVMGLAQHRIWYALQMMQITINSPILANLFDALRANLKLLALTYALLLVFVLLGANISYYNFSPLFNPLGGRGNGFNCYTLSQCWLVHVDTLRSGGGIGDATDWPVFFSKDGYAYWVMLYRIAYYLVVGLVGANLFLGVIIDSLTQHRTHQQLIETDQKKKCFICGIERSEFDMVRPGAYDTHIAEEHNMWQYLYFFLYLSEKDPRMYTGQEAYVQQLIGLRDLTFFPIASSLTLNAKDHSAADGPVDDGGIVADDEEDAEDSPPPVATGAPSAGGSDAEGNGGGGDGKSSGAIDESTACLIASLVRSALKEGLDPVLEQLGNTTECMKDICASGDTGSGNPFTSRAAPVPLATVSPRSAPLASAGS
ncbi:hypothetical protein CUR178_05618 [Leishmania enriettii]|uniref:MIR domain-containing protein n=1 Tax=Leishmania enriettii TaxID=5663 RepID=A0A836KP41_LEIEN|nr:hypothetical protein CUR178_05618 [Leishmania enriettii]